MDLQAKVESIKGIGEKTTALLNKAGIFTVRDLLYFLPRDYENFQNSVKIAELRPGKVMIRGKISELKTAHTRRRGLSITTGKISDETGAIRVVWFNQPYRVKQFDEDGEYYFTGSYDLKSGRYQLTSPSAILAEDVEKQRRSSNLHPIYSQKGGIKPAQFNKFFENLRPEFAKIPDLLPGVKTGVRKEALFSSHFPDTTEEVKRAREYLAYEELFELILASKLSKQENQKLRARPLKFELEKTKEVIGKLPFKLTDAQRRATWDILQDMERDTPMNRLLQGDVGSGKTVVAAISAYQAHCNGAQTALLAPTAILATQHYEGLKPLLEPLGVKLALLTGATKHKEALKKQLKEGKIDFLIGTHAIITDDTVFSALALCIIDEQHRFGVEQRQKLLMKTARNTENERGVNAINRGSAGTNMDSTGINRGSAMNTTLAPHLLSMTATPIPRSLQLTLFGDLDISILNQLPQGRKPITTKIIREIDQKEKLFPEVSKEISEGHQVYWICKNIEENPQLETTSVKRQAKRLQGIFNKARVEFLHGRMKPAEKDEVMERFARGEIDILVSTTVVEVGVNVPNATLMVIADAEGYGLAQLHQLRGRVGRGEAKSYCYLISGSEERPSRRLMEMEKSTDGFHLAEVDLNLRGPGEIYGSLQHGALDLRIATLSDTRLIARAANHAQVVAQEILKNPDFMVKYKELMSGISHYQQLTTLN